MFRDSQGTTISATELTNALEGYTMTKSALHFPVDRPLPRTLVEKLIAARLDA